MRGARTKQGAMRVALTTVVAVLAVLAEPVLGETQPLIGKTVTARVDGSGTDEIEASDQAGRCSARERQVTEP